MLPAEGLAPLHPHPVDDNGLETKPPIRPITEAEALIAISVFTLLGAAVLSGSTATRSASASAEQAAVAEDIARNQLETILAAPYQDPPHSYALIRYQRAFLAWGASGAR